MVIVIPSILSMIVTQIFPHMACQKRKGTSPSSEKPVYVRQDTGQPFGRGIPRRALKDRRAAFGAAGQQAGR